MILIFFVRWKVVLQKILWSTTRFGFPELAAAGGSVEAVRYYKRRYHSLICICHMPDQILSKTLHYI